MNRTMMTKRIRRRFGLGLAGLAGTIAVLALAPCLSHAQDKPAARKPNVILILADDLGWRDLACFGSQYYESPKIDALCAEGMKFTQAYAAAPLCSPTRASIMTGESPARLHLTNVVNLKPQTKDGWREPDWTPYLPADAVTIAELLKQQGYVTGITGKWHLDRYFPPETPEEKVAQREEQPDRQGFDEAYSVAAGVNRFGPWAFEEWNIDAKDRGTKDDYITERQADRAITFIEKHQITPHPHPTQHPGRRNQISY